MARQKQQRWYETEGERAYIYNRPFPQDATAVSIVPVADLAFYRTGFDLKQIYQEP